MFGQVNLLKSQAQQVPEAPSDGCYTTQEFDVYKTADLATGNPLNEDWLVGCLDESYTFVALNFDDNDNNRAWRWKIEKATINVGNTTTYTTIATSSYFLPPYTQNSTINWTNTIPLSSGTGYYKVILERYNYLNNQLVTPPVNIYQNSFDLFGGNPYTLTVSYDNCNTITLNSDLVGLISTPCSDPSWAGADQAVAVNWGDGIGGNVHVSNRSGPKFPIPAHQYTTPGYYTIELTNNVATCNVNQTQQLQVWIGNPNVVLSSTNSTICQSSTTAQTISTTVQSATPVTYAWSQSTGGAITTTTSNITVNPTVTTTYNVTVTDGNGCSTTASTTITVVNCCPGGNHNGTPLTFYNTTASQLISIFGTNTITTTATIAINNLLDVNTNITFANCSNIVFGTEATVQLQNSRILTINGSTLRSCTGNMWGGIRLNHSSQSVVVSTNSFIRDAIYGILSSNNSKVQVTNSVFRNCYMGMQINDNKGGLQFSCVKATFETFPTNVPLLNVPLSISTVPLTRSFTGIEFNNSSVQLNGGSTTNQNIFRNLECGVFCSNSSINIFNFNFIENCTNTTNKTRSGFGLFSNNSNTASPTTLSVGTGTVYPQNVFKGNLNGLYIQGRTIASINYNQFQSNSNNAINVLGNINSSTLNINFNRFNGGGNLGVFWWANNQTNTTISNNIFDGTRFAMLLQGNDHPSTLLNVFQNDIFSPQLGIQAVDLVNPTINDNYINYANGVHAGLEKVGITISSCSGVTANRNFVNGNTSGTTPQTLTRGISVVASPNTTLECDSMVRCQFAIRGLGNSSSSRLRSNAFRDCNAGVVIDGQGSQLGLQAWISPPFTLSTNDNKWYGTFSVGHTATYNGADGSLTGFVFRTSYTNTTNPQSFFPAQFFTFNDNNSNPTTISVISVAVPLLACLAQSQYNTNKTVDPAVENVAIFERVAQGDFIYTPDMADALEQWDQSTLFKELGNNEELRAASTVLDSFYQANLYTALAQYEAGTKAAAQAHDSISATFALAQLDALAPQTLIEQNTKAIQEIYLQTYAMGLMGLDSVQLSTVRNVAKQCFVFGGPAVFLARSMYNAAIGYVDNSFQDYCLANYGSYKQPNKTPDPQIYFYLFPNPKFANSSLFIEASKAGNVVFYNSHGQEVFQSGLTVGINQLELEQISSGIYLYVSRTIDGEHFTGKIIID